MLEQEIDQLRKLVFPVAVKQLREKTGMGLKDAVTAIYAYEAITGFRFTRINECAGIGFTPLEEVWLVYADDGLHGEILIGVHLTKTGADEHIASLKSDDSVSDCSGFSYTKKFGELEL